MYQYNFLLINYSISISVWTSLPIYFIVFLWFLTDGLIRLRNKFSNLINFLIPISTHILMPRILCLHISISILILTFIFHIQLRSNTSQLFLQTYLMFTLNFQSSYQLPNIIFFLTFQYFIFFLHFFQLFSFIFVIIFHILAFFDNSLYFLYNAL